MLRHDGVWSSDIADRDDLNAEAQMNLSELPIRFPNCTSGGKRTSPALVPIHRYPSAVRVIAAGGPRRNPSWMRHAACANCEMCSFGSSPKAEFTAKKSNRRESDSGRAILTGSVAAPGLPARGPDYVQVQDMVGPAKAAANGIASLRFGILLSRVLEFPR